VRHEFASELTAQSGDGRCGGDESSSVFVGPQFRLFGGHSSAVEFDQTGLPFVYQLRGLTRAALGAGKHPLHMDALLGRFVGRAGGMIGHMILTHKERRTTGFYQARLSAGRGACPSGQALD
jgi:hypothetical protein